MPRTRQRQANGADLIEVYTDKGDTFRQAVSEWRSSQRVAKVRTFTRTVRAGGGVAVVYCVCVWYTATAKAQGWDR